MAVFDDESMVRGLNPDLAAVARLDHDGISVGVIATAPSRTAGIDCVSRYFAPARGLDEDPVTGAAHCRIVPYWADRLGRTEITAFQASARGGLLHCELRGDRIVIAGRSVAYLRGTVHLPNSVANGREVAA